MKLVQTTPEPLRILPPGAVTTKVARARLVVTNTVPEATWYSPLKVIVSPTSRVWVCGGGVV